MAQVTMRAVLGSLLLAVIAGCGTSSSEGQTNPGSSTFGDFKTAAAFVDVTDEAFEPAPETFGVPGLALFDYDNDGDVDVFIANGLAKANLLYQNDGSGRFEDMASAAGVSFSPDHGVCTGIGDFDNDGWLDLIIGRQIELFDAPGRAGVRFLKNMGPDDDGVVRFEERTDLSGLNDVEFAASIGVGDIDNDGLLDLYIGRYDFRDADFAFSSYLPDTPNRLFRNTGITDGVPIFEDITDSAGVAGTYESGLAPSTADISTRVPTFTVYFTDVNVDGYLDLFSLHEVPGGVDLFINNGDLTFTLAQQDLLDHHGGWMGITGADFDGDADLDYFIANVGADAPQTPLGDTHVTNSYFLPDGTPFHLLLSNDGAGNFTDVAMTTAVQPGALPPTNRHGAAGLAAYEFGFGCAWFDADNDGWSDLTWIGNIVVFSDFGEGPLRVDFHGVGRFLKNNGDGSFLDQTGERGLFVGRDDQPLGFGYGASGHALGTSDLNGDGSLDLCRSYLSAERAVECLLNPLNESNHWIIIRLQGTQSNRFGIGARVTVDAGARQFVGEVLTTTSAFTAVHPQVHFGLGSADIIDQLTVNWPSGAVTLRSGMPTNQVITINENE